MGRYAQNVPSNLVACIPMQVYCWLEKRNAREETSSRGSIRARGDHTWSGGGPMGRNLSLNVGDLAVSSFETGEGGAAARGTVLANAACTCNASCVCPSAIYW